MDRSAPKTAPLSAFLDLDDAQPLPPLDRSKLENYATCPAMARFIETGRVLNASAPMDAGNEVHAAFSEATAEYVASDASLNARELVDIATGRLFRSRPDVQPDAVEAAKYALWPWAKYLVEIHPANVLRFDGGQGKRSGQLSHDVDWLGATLTSEVDLLYSGPAKSVLHEVDYKSGRTSFPAAAVAKSFQFQMHAYLVFQNFEAVNELEVSIWETRCGRPNPPVTFKRDDLPQYEARIMAAAQFWKAYHEREPDDCPTWPGREKCCLCPAARLCPIQPPAACMDDPKAFVLGMHVLSVALEQMEIEASLFVEQFGDIVTEQGVAYGLDKPVTRRPSPSLYTL